MFYVHLYSHDYYISITDTVLPVYAIQRNANTLVTGTRKRMCDDDDDDDDQPFGIAAAAAHVYVICVYYDICEEDVSLSLWL